GGAVTNVAIKLLVGDPSVFGPTAGEFKTAWDPATGATPDCFVRFSPDPAAEPDAGVASASSVVVSFSEPMDPGSVQAFDTFPISYDPTNLPTGASPLMRKVVGHISPSLDLREFSFVPELPLRHVQGSTELFTVDLAGGATGVTDLAGNALVAALPQTDFT